MVKLDFGEGGVGEGGVMISADQEKGKWRRFLAASLSFICVCIRSISYRSIRMFY